MTKYISEIREIKLSKRTIEYELTRKPVKNINLRIKPSGEIHVSANNSVPTDYIDNFIKEKEDFIIKALDSYEEKRKNLDVSPKRYVSDEEFTILGNKLTLVVSEGRDESVASDKEHIYLVVQDKNDIRHKENLIKEWIKALTIETFEEICLETYEKFKKYGVKYPNKITIRYMTSRWGSCRPTKGNITLNSKLIEVPRKSIEYVVLHEFAHFVHPNHSKDFYNLITKLMPDWRERKSLL